MKKEQKVLHDFCQKGNGEPERIQQARWTGRSLWGEKGKDQWLKTS